MALAKKVLIANRGEVPLRACGIVAPFKVVVQSAPLPKTPVGKVLRKDLREPYWHGHTHRVGGRLMSRRSLGSRRRASRGAPA
jgi:acyl-CoA synthetase (AMP-forming)/AMP-acid ligase II